jgi:alpha-methylacyl-CoA racemase
MRHIGKSFMTDSPAKTGPLKGIKIVELAGIGPGPYAGQLLSDMGADVIVIDRPGGSIVPKGIDARGKRSMVLDLKKPEAVAALLKIVATADVLIEGLRPGVTERMGVGPDVCHAINPRLIYGRMTGWGQTGPWSQMAGHDINYIGMTGVLNAIGKDGQPPVPPLNMVGDFGGGSMFLVNGILAAIIERAQTGRGNIVDAAIVDGTHSLMSFVHGMAGVGQWRTKREANLLDGAAPFYRCYMTADGKFMAVGCIEPQFFAAMMERLPIDREAYGAQHDHAAFAKQHEMLEDVFATKTRDAWEAIFAGTDACVTPVLDYVEAASHPVNAERHAVVTDGRWLHPQVAPRLATQALPTHFDIATKGADYAAILAESGLSADDISQLIAAGAVVTNKD